LFDFRLLQQYLPQADIISGTACARSMKSKINLAGPIIFVILNVEPGFGRKPKLTAHQCREALKRLDAGETTRKILGGSGS
jgi:hypothetical protein